MTIPALKASLTLWQRRLAYRHRQVIRKQRRKDLAGIRKWQRLEAQAQRIVVRREKQLADRTPLRERAFNVAASLIGVMEEGGNNVGPVVTKIILANAGTPGESWCGDFDAFCYRTAGSTAVTRSWAAVRLLGGVAGVSRTRAPERGDLVRFTFDHTGLYDHDNGDGTITTVEGNTGPTGAVSDSSTGGDGVYRKVRPKLLVLDYLRVHR